MVLLNVYALYKRSDETWSRRSLCSSVKIRDTIFEEIFLIPKFFLRICHTFFVLLFASSAVGHTLNHRSEYIRVGTLIVVYISYLYFWQFSKTSFMQILPLFPKPYVSRNFFIACSTLAFFNSIYVSLTLLPIFIQNLLLMYCFGSVLGIMVIVLGNGLSDSSSNPGREWLHFT